MKDINNYRGYEKQLLNTGYIKMVERNVPIPSGCWMCGLVGVKMSKEHVIPDWLQKHFDIGEEISRQAHVDYRGNVLGTREVKLASLRQGSICYEHCNHGWMRKSEGEFKYAFLQGWENQHINHPLLFARWIAKTLTVINISQPRRVLIPAEARHGLSDLQHLPDGWSIYVYRTDTDMPEKVLWEQGGYIEARAQKDEVPSKDLEQIFAGCLKIDDMVGVAFWAPSTVNRLEPVFPMLKLWQLGEGGEVPTLPYGGYLFNQCMINIGVDEIKWDREFEKRRKKVVKILKDGNS